MSFRARAVCFIVGLVVLGMIALLVRRRRVYNVYAITWLITGLIFMAIAVNPILVDEIAAFFGIYSAANAFLAIGLGSCLMILLHLSVIVTEQHKHIRRFEKELALHNRRGPSSKS